MARLSRSRLPRFGGLGFALLVFVQVGAIGATAPAQAVEVPSAPAGLTPAEQAEIDALLAPGWQSETTLRGSVGWRDNVLLSPFLPEARAFGRGELEFMAWRPAQRGWEFLSFLNGDWLRYFAPPAETSGEQQWFVHAETRWDSGHGFRASLKGDGFFQDTVVDLSETETTRLTLPARTYGGFVTAMASVPLPAAFTLEPFGQLRTTRYHEIPGDYGEDRWGARLEWKRSDAFTVSAAYTHHQRRYHQRNAYTLGGRPLTGTRLRFSQNEFEVRGVGHWDSAKAWRTGLTLGQLESRDGGSGYFDYNQRRARLELTWTKGAWTVSEDAEAKRVEYRNQTVGTGIAPPARVADAYDTITRVERAITPLWTVFAEHHWERNRSNEAEFSYRATSVLAGVQRTF